MLPEFRASQRIQPHRHTQTHGFWQIQLKTFCVATVNLKCNLNALAIATGTDNDYGTAAGEGERAGAAGAASAAAAAKMAVGGAMI